MGIKVFLSAIELFGEVTPQLGWRSHSYSNSNQNRVSNSGVYWAVGLHVGARLWW